MIIGKNGTLGKAFVRICDQRGITCIALGREDIDILDEVNVETVFEKYQPWGVINATGYVKVDEAEIDCENCRSVNTIAPGILARVCAAKEIRFMSFSSDIVFDGSKKSPYHETDIALPLNVYGRSKSEGEKLVLGENSSSLIIRTSAFFGPWDRYNFVYHVLNTLQQEKTMTLPGDVIISPTYVPDLCHTAMDLFIDDVEGIWHLSNEGMTTWAEFGNIIADRSGCKKRRLVSKPLAEMGWRAPRPLYSVLESDRGVKLPPLDTAIERFFAQREV